MPTSLQKDKVEEVIAIYQNEFRPNENLKKPKINICLWSLISETMKSQYLFSSRAFGK